MRYTETRKIKGTSFTKRRIVSLLLAFLLLAGSVSGSLQLLISGVNAAEENSSTDNVILDFGSDGWAYKTNVGDTAIPDELPEIDDTWITGAKLPLGFGSSNGDVDKRLNNGGTSNARDTHTTMAYVHGSGTNLGSSTRLDTIAVQKTLDIPDIEGEDFDGFLLSAVVDDGTAVLVNGKIAALLNAEFVGNANSTCVAYGYKRVGVVGIPFANTDPSHSVWTDVPLDKSLFNEGENTITLLMLNDKPESTDLYVDIKLEKAPISPEFDFGSDGWAYKTNVGGTAIPDELSEIDETWIAGIKLPLGFGKSGEGVDNHLTNGGTSTAADKDTGVTIPYIHSPGTNLGSSTRLSTIAVQKDLYISSLDGIDGFIVNAVVDDGLALLINGKEAALLNAEFVGDSNNICVAYGYKRIGTINNPINNDDDRGQSVWKDVPIDISLFNEGENTITLLMLNDKPESSDIYADISLRIAREEEEVFYEGKSFVMTPGRNESEMGFTWYTANDPAATSGSAVKIEKTLDYDENGFTQDSIFSGTMTAADGTWRSNKVTVTGLEADTEYSYRYGNTVKDEWSRTYTFKTGGEQSTFIYLSDIQIGAGNIQTDTDSWIRTAGLSTETVPGASFFLTGGDNINNQNNESQFDGLFAPEQLRNYPVAPANGNHDFQYINFQNHFNLPNKTDYVVTGGGRCWYFSYGDALFIMLNATNMGSEYTSVDFGHGDDRWASEYKSAIQEAVASNPEAKWRIATFHFDVYGAGGHAARSTDVTDPNLITYMAKFRENVTPLLDEFGVDVVFNGHDHTYARSYFMKDMQAQANQTLDDDGAIINPDGILYIAAGTATGSKYYGVERMLPWLALRNTERLPQFNGVVVTDNEFSLTAYQIAANGTVNIIDQITLRKTEKEEPLRQKGDVNGDLVVNIFDIMAIRDHIFGKSILEELDYWAADISDDDKINIFCIMAIRDHIFGKANLPVR